MVSFVGGGGKSTLMFAFADALAGRGRIVMTTTTKMGRDQIPRGTRVCRSLDECARGPESGPIMLVVGGDAHKITGPVPDELDRAFGDAGIDYLLVEADGAHGRPLKAPAPHEPVVPKMTTLVVIAVGVDAIGRPLVEVAHRIEQAVAFTGASESVLVSPDLCARIIVHPEGALRVAPREARVVVAITKVDAMTAPVARELSDLLTQHSRVDAVVAVPDLSAQRRS